MLEREQGIITMHCIGRSYEHNIHVRRGAKLLPRCEAVRDFVLGAVCERCGVISSPHAGKCGLLTLWKRREQSPDRMVTEAKNREAHKRHETSRKDERQYSVGVSERHS
jgi:hypothetical protein